MTPSLARLFGNKNEQPFRLNNLGAEMPADAPADTRAPLNGAGGATSPGASKPVPAGSPDQPSSAASGAKKKKNKPKKSATGAPASAEVSPDALNGGDASAETGEADPASAGAALLDSADVIDTVNNFVGLAMRASAAACGVGKERAGGAADGRSSSASPPPESVVMPPRPSSPWLDTPNGDSAERGARDTGSNGSQGFVTPDSEAGGEATPPSAFQDAPEERLREGEPDSDDEDAPAQMGADAQTTAAKRKKKKKKKAAASSVTGTVAGEAGKENISEVKQGQQRAGAADGTGASPSASGSAPGSTSSPAAPSSSSTSKPAKPIAPVKKESEGAEKLRSRREQLLSRRSVTTRPIRTQSGKAAAVSSDAKGVDPSLSKDQAEAIMSYTSQVFFHNYLRQVVGVNGAAGISVMQPRGSDDEREVISRKKRDEERQRQILENLRRMHGGEWELNSTPLARMKYDFVQTPQDVQLHIMIPNVSAEEIDVKWLEDKKLEIRFPTVQFHSDESGVLALNLFASVVPSKTKIECTPKKVTITLRKVKAAPWDKLEQSKKDAKRFAEGAEGLPAAIATDIAEMRAQDIDEIVSKIEGKTMVAGVLPPGKRGSTFNGKGTGSKGDSKRRSSAADPELTLVEEVEGTPVVTLPANWMQSSPVSNELDGTLPLSTEPANENEDGLVDAELAVGSLVPKPRAHLPAGLLNMGQTCYLNSILQAIVSIPAIGRYFSDDAYLKDINTENFLGHKGEVARAFATIVRQLLTPGAPSFKPKAFMDVLRRVWHILQDEYQQHDAQELMQFLLDAVHEDLNRVKDRKSVPPFEEKEGETDDAAAKRFWEHHNTLNDSEMVRLFQGLLKNKVECKSCGKVSFKFDPFMYFTVELPEERVQVEVRSTSVTGKRTVYPPQGMAKEARFEDVLKRLDLKDGIVCTLGEGGTMIKTVPKKNDRLSSMLTYAQSQGPVELASFDVERDCAYLALHHEAAMPGRVGARPAKFGYPLILSVPPGMYTRNELYRVVLDKLKACGVVSAAVDSSSDPPPFVVRPFDNKPRGPNSPVSPDESDDKKRAAEEAEQVGTVPPASEEPFASLQPTKFLRIALDWRPDAKDSVYLDKGFPDSDCDNEDGINGTLGAGSPAKAGSLLRTTSPTRFGPRSATNPPPITLEDCMHAFCAPEDLDNDWTCEKCKGKVGRKTLSLHSVPEIFIVALKRFRWLDNPGGYSYNKKIDVHVEFPLEMEMGGGQYKLFAVVNHYGSTFSGHYTTYCDRSWIHEQLLGETDKTGAEKEAEWYEFDDEAVRKMDESEVQTRSAYVLFYRRVHPVDGNNGKIAAAL